MKRVREKEKSRLEHRCFNGVFSSRKALLCSCLAVALMAVVPHRVHAGGEGVGKSKACLIIPPDIKKAVAARTGGLVRTADPMAPATGGRVVSFFKGKMEKFGVGTPDSFRIGSKAQARPVAGAQMLSSDPIGYSEAMEGDFEQGNFFPTVGYFNRASRDGTSAIAVGVGLKGPSGSPDGDPPGNPSAGVALMIGFGF